jgi:pimeloyl-ACP methyl ester carboxylesterase
MKQGYGVSRRPAACRAFASLSVIFAIPAAQAAAQPVRTTATAITWQACASDLVPDRWTSVFGDRLECGNMLTAVEEGLPAKGMFSVGLVRLKAGDAAQRQGSLFFNFGGPGANPLDLLPATGYLLATRPADDPLHGDKRRLADRFDLVAVIPRGLRGGTRIACRPGPDADAGVDPTIYLADWNWAGLVKDAKAYASGCGENPLQRYAGTLQHVRDMEQARRALGDAKMNFIGSSYGSWVGAFYAASYPEHSGRIVLDSVMNYAGTFEEQADDLPPERQALFERYALHPALVSPRAYGLGTDAKAVMARFRSMPHQAREAWASVIVAPAHLAAALTLADWIRAEGNPGNDRLMALVRGHVFSSDADVDEDIRVTATDLVARLGEREDPTSGGIVDLPVYHAVVCGDTPWRKDAKGLRAMANDIGNRYPAANGLAVTTGLTCANWPTGPRWRPALTEVAKAPPMLMVQAEFDPATPLSGAMKAFRATPGAYMVLARGANVHGLFGDSATPCIESAVGRFLLTGELPAIRQSSCDFEPLPGQRQRREAIEGPTESEVRAELARFRKHI